MILRAPSGGARFALWRRIDLRRLVLGDMPLKAAAIAVALLLWVSSVHNAAPEEVTVQLEGRVPIERPEVPGGYVLRGSLGDVGVKLRGPGGAASAIGVQQLRASVDLSAVVPGPDAQEAPVRVEVADERVRVVEIVPASVTVRLERRTSRILAVQARLANEPPAGYHASPATFRPQEVTVSGPESVVAAVVAVLGTVLFGDVPIDLAQDVRPVPVDAAGAPIDGLEVDPVAVRVTIPVLPGATTRTVPVMWRLSGAVAPGYWISRVVTDPVAVTLSGDPGLLGAVDQVETAPVDVSGLATARTIVTTLVLPPGVVLLGATEARVSFTVVALVGTRPFPLVAVVAAGLDPGLVAQVDPPTVEVVLAGSVPTLNGLGPGSVTATVDVSGKTAGTYVLDAVIRSPDGTTAQSVQPPRVTVTISARPSPTP